MHANYLYSAPEERPTAMTLLQMPFFRKHLATIFIEQVPQFIDIYLVTSP
jgi:hypothetical protein